MVMVSYWTSYPLVRLGAWTGKILGLRLPLDCSESQPDNPEMYDSLVLI